MTHGPLFISLPVSAILLSAVRWGAAWDEWHLCLAKIRRVPSCLRVLIVVHAMSRHSEGDVKGLKLKVSICNSNSYNSRAEK